MGNHHSFDGSKPDIIASAYFHLHSSAKITCDDFGIIFYVVWVQILEPTFSERIFMRYCINVNEDKRIFFCICHICSETVNLHKNILFEGNHKRKQLFIHSWSVIHTKTRIANKSRLHWASTYYILPFDHTFDDLKRNFNLSPLS